MSRDHINKIFQLIDLRSAMTFASVGALATLLYFILFTILWHYLHINYKAAVSIAYLSSAVLHFTANRNITFKCHGHKLYTLLSKYIVMVLVNYLITLSVVHWVVSVLLLSPYIGIVLAIGITVSTGYLMARFWVFKHSVNT